jgi:hydrogenase nickel incorporation protein HypA/HybF
MHELSICQALIEQVEAVAREQNAARVLLIRLGIGPLSGVEPQLLEQAFSIARAGSIAADAELQVTSLPIQVSCAACGSVSEVQPARLVCATCGNWQTTLVSGDELQLTQVELTRKPATAAPPLAEQPAASGRIN